MKNFFSYFTNVKVIAVMLVFGIFAGTAGYVFAYSMRSNVHRPSNLASGTVNVTPNGSTNVDANTARVSYIVSYADMKSSDGSQSANRLNVLVPRDATNVNFTLIGTIEKPETPFMTNNGKYTEKPVNVNLPLTMGTDSRDPYLEPIKMPTGEEINAGNANAAVVVDRGIASNSRLYTLPALHSSHPAAVKVEFDIAKNSQESHIPLRAYKPLHCLLEACDSL